MLIVRQALVKDEGLDALVLVPGMDGAYNWGSQQAVGYLLEGHSGRDILDVTKLRTELEDIILVIGQTSVGLYTAPDARASLWPLIMPEWQNIDLFCSEELEDQDMREADKIGALVQLLRGKSKLGFALSPGDKGAPGQSMDVEKWALIQAYGLEGIGRPGFLTMNFEVSASRLHAYMAMQPSPAGMPAIGSTLTAAKRRAHAGEKRIRGAPEPVCEPRLTRSGPPAEQRGPPHAAALARGGAGAQHVPPLRPRKAVRAPGAAFGRPP